MNEANTAAPGSKRLAAIVGGLTGLLGFGAIQYRRSNRRAAMRALRDTVEPPDPVDPLAATTARPLDDEAHAPGHHHLSMPPEEAPRRRHPRSVPRLRSSGVRQHR